MTRNLTDPNYDDTFEWQERVTDVNGDSLTITLILDAIDDGTGYSDDGRDSSSISWLDFTTTTNTINGDETEVLVDITADAASLNSGYKYRFEIKADDGFGESSRTFVVERA